MKAMDRRTFLNTTAKASGAMLAAPAFIREFVTNAPSDRVNVAVVGVSGERPRVRGIPRGRGMRHIQGYAQVPNVRVTAVCDVDERLLPAAVDEVEELYGATPKTEVDFRELLGDDDIDVISVVTPNHWHALQTIWACQAGKDVYVEKPVSHNISEGRKMVEAARKYDRVVLAGMTRRFTRAVLRGVALLHEGNLGTPYMAKSMIYSHRESIGVTPNRPVPDGVHWDMFLGPAPYRPFSENRFLYNWHWMWDTGNGDIANLGIYELDVARWALNKHSHPVSVHSTGGVFGRDSDRETPNFLTTTFEYEDGTILQAEVRSLYTNMESASGSPRSTIIYTDEGWMEITGSGYQAYVGRADEPEFSLSSDDVFEEERIDGWQEFIDCVRDRQISGFRNNIIEGHRSAVLPHLANISYRTGRKLSFDPSMERFVDDNGANRYLSRDYRAPYLMPEAI